MECFCKDFQNFHYAEGLNCLIIIYIRNILQAQTRLTHVKT